MKDDVLITGATGLIGGEIAWRLMRSGRRVWCIIRGNSFPEAAARLERRFVLSGQVCDWSRLVALPGDVTQPQLGLNHDSLHHLRRECCQVIHCAADTSFATHNSCARVNVIGTRNVLNLSKAMGPQVRLLYMSSAARCLTSETGVIHEDDPPAGFSNDYVLSKRDCEQLVLRAPISAVVLRPSIVLSEGVNSTEFARSVLWVLPIIRRLGVVPIDGSELLDMVSVRFVADSVLQMLNRNSLDRIYHISAGPAGSVTGQALLDALTRDGHDYAQVRFMPGMDWTSFGKSEPRVKRLKALLAYYLPVLGADVVYDCSRLRRDLGDHLPPSPRATDYCSKLLDLFRERDAFDEGLKP